MGAQTDAEGNLYTASLFEEEQETKLHVHDAALELHHEVRVPHVGQSTSSLGRPPVGSVALSPVGAVAWGFPLSETTSSEPASWGVRLTFVNDASTVTADIVEATLTSRMAASLDTFFVATEDLDGAPRIDGYDIDGQHQWSRELTLPATQLVVHPDGSLIAGGAVVIGLDPENGDILWEFPWLSQRGTDDVVVSETGVTRALGRDSMPLPSSWMIDLSSSGRERARQTWGDVPAFPTRSAIFSTDGNLVVLTEDNVLTKYDPDLQPLWQNSTAYGDMIHPLPNGMVLTSTHNTLSFFSR